MPDDMDMVVLGGSGSPRLTRAICTYLGTAPAAGEVLRFSDGNLFVRIKENVRGREAYLVQSTVFPTNDSFMELLFWIDALKRASARSVTVVMSYFSYAKGDKKRTSPGSPSAPASAPTPSRPPAPTGSSRSTCTHPRSRASSASPWTCSTRCPCCASGSAACSCPTSSWSRPTAAS